MPEEDNGGLDLEDWDNLDDRTIPGVYDQDCVTLFGAHTRSRMNSIGSRISSLESDGAEEEQATTTATVTYTEG